MLGGWCNQRGGIRGKDRPKTSLSTTLSRASSFWTMPRGAGSGRATTRVRRRERVVAVNFMVVVGWDGWGWFGLVW